MKRNILRLGHSRPIDGDKPHTLPVTLPSPSVDLAEASLTFLHQALGLPEAARDSGNQALQTMRVADFQREFCPYPALGHAGGLSRGLAVYNQRRRHGLSQGTHDNRCHCGQLDVGSLHCT
jgi:hypothetical protein